MRKYLLLLAILACGILPSFAEQWSVTCNGKSVNDKDVISYSPTSPIVFEFTLSNPAATPSGSYADVYIGIELCYDPGTGSPVKEESSTGKYIYTIPTESFKNFLESSGTSISFSLPASFYTNSPAAKWEFTLKETAEQSAEVLPVISTPANGSDIMLPDDTYHINLNCEDIDLSTITLDKSKQGYYIYNGQKFEQDEYQNVYLPDWFSNPNSSPICAYFYSSFWKNTPGELTIYIPEGFMSWPGGHNAETTLKFNIVVPAPTFKVEPVNNSDVKSSELESWLMVYFTPDSQKAKLDESVAAETTVKFGDNVYKEQNSVFYNIAQDNNGEYSLCLAASELEGKSGELTIEIPEGLFTIGSAKSEACTIVYNINPSGGGDQPGNAPIAFMLGDRKVDYFQGFPATAGMTLVFTGTDGTAYKYSLDDSDPTQDFIVGTTNPISITKDMEGKTVTMKYQLDGSDAISEFSFDVKSWVKAHSLDLFKEGTFFIVAAADGSKALGDKIVNNNVNVVATTGSANQQVLYYTPGISVFQFTNNHAKAINPENEGKNFLDYYYPNIYLETESEISRYTSGKVNFIDRCQINNYKNPADSSNKKVLDSPVMELQTRIINFNSASLGYNQNYIFDKAPNQAVYIGDNKPLEFTVTKEYYDSETGNLTKSEILDSSIPDAVDANGNYHVQMGYNDQLKISTSDEIAKIKCSWKEQTISDKEPVVKELVAEGNVISLKMPKQNGTRNYEFSAYNYDEKSVASISIEVKVNGNSNYRGEEKNRLVFEHENFKSFFGEANSETEPEWLTSGNLSRTYDHTSAAFDDIRLFIPGGENQVAYVKYDYNDIEHLMLNDNSMIRLGLPTAGRRLISITVEGQNLEQLRFGKVNHGTVDNVTSSVYPGQHQATGVFVHNTLGTDAAKYHQVKWTFDPMETDLSSIEIWNAPAAKPSGLRRRAAGVSPQRALLQSIAIGTDVSTAVDTLTDCDTPAAYYNLRGERIEADALTPGIYIKVANGKAEKILVK